MSVPSPVLADSQVTSLHFHFPWLIKANLRWSLFCAATKRRINTDLNWRAYFDIADSDRSFEEKIEAYAKIAQDRFDSEEFYEFCDKHLANLDEIAHEFFGGEAARDAIRQKVEALFPAHEVDDFTELFWTRVQTGRDNERTQHS